MDWLKSRQCGCCHTSWLGDILRQSNRFPFNARSPRSEKKKKKHLQNPLGMNDENDEKNECEQYIKE